MYPVGIKSTQYDQGIFLMIFVRRIDERGGRGISQITFPLPPSGGLCWRIMDMKIVDVLFTPAGRQILRLLLKGPNV